MPYREQVRVPLGWWALALLLAVTLLLVFGLSIGPGWGIGAAVAGLAIAVALFRTIAVTIEVDEDEIRIGRAVIERRYVGEVVPLDAAAARRRSGVEADARAHLVLRPWLPTAVELTLVDAADPVPYWLVSTRRPQALARALVGERPAT